MGWMDGSKERNGSGDDGSYLLMTYSQRQKLREREREREQQGLKRRACKNKKTRGGARQQAPLADTASRSLPRHLAYIVAESASYSKTLQHEAQMRRKSVGDWCKKGQDRCANSAVEGIV